MRHESENANTVEQKKRGRPRNTPAAPTALRARGRTDIDARVKREILERTMLANLESAGDFFAGPGVADQIVALASGVRSLREVDDLRAADEALQEFAERMIQVWRIWKEADRAVREIECEFGIGC